jgi:hypothetical protein
MIGTGVHYFRPPLPLPMDSAAESVAEESEFESESSASSSDSEEAAAEATDVAAAGEDAVPSRENGAVFGVRLVSSVAPEADEPASSPLPTLNAEEHAADFLDSGPPTPVQDEMSEELESSLS